MQNGLTNVIKHGGITVMFELVTPEIAKAYLEKNTRNRNLMKGWAASMAADMTQGRWCVTHEGIAFDANGCVADGQHRLEAVVESRIPQLLLVTRGLSHDAMYVIGRAKQRKLAHTLKIMGYAHSDTDTTAVARRMRLGPVSLNSIPISDLAAKAFIDRHLEAIAFSKGAISKSAGPASIRAVIARAYYHCDLADLERFGQILSTGEGSEPGARSVRMLRDMLIRVRANGTSGGSVASVVIYQKAQNAMYCFVQGKDLQRLHAVAEDLYPLPKEKEEVAHAPDMQHQPA